MTVDDAAPEVEPEPRPLYARLLFLRHLNPSGVMCFLFFEGAMAVGVLLALAELVTVWAVPVLPLVVAVMVKINDLVAGAVVRSARRVPDRERARFREERAPVIGRAAVAGRGVVTMGSVGFGEASVPPPPSTEEADVGDALDGIEPQAGNGGDVAVGPTRSRLPASRWPVQGGRGAGNMRRRGEAAHRARTKRAATRRGAAAQPDGDAGTGTDKGTEIAPRRTGIGQHRAMPTAASDDTGRSGLNARSMQASEPKAPRHWPGDTGESDTGDQRSRQSARHRYRDPG